MSPARRIRRILGPLLGTVVVLAVLILGVFPTRTYLDQRRATASAQEQLQVLRSENDALEERVARLHDDAEIERLAREQYNLVFPGEEAYALLPGPGPAGPAGDQGDGAADDERGGQAAEPTGPSAADTDLAAHDRPNVFERVLDGLASIF